MIILRKYPPLLIYSGIFTPEDQLLEQGEHHDGVHFIKVNKLDY